MTGMTSYSNEGAFSLRKDSGMRFPSRMSAWMYVCVLALGLGLQTRAAAESQERGRSTDLEQPCDVDFADEPCTLGAPERRQIFEDIFEYSFPVRVGPGEHDFITLHRVVREVSSGVPVRTPKSVFLVHGDAWGFRGAFLASAASSDVSRRQHSLAVFLAKRGVDVWGIDLRWVGVPQGTTDFSFMKDWNLGLHARDVGLGIKLARATRAYFSNEVGRMVLLGWSRGATISYAYLNAETQLPPEKRHVSGFIPVDMAYTFAPEHVEERKAACQSHALFAQLQAAGMYEGGQVGLLMQSLGGFALTAQDAASPIFSGFTNRQAGLLMGGATHMLQNPAIIPGYHWTGGEFSAGLPSGLSWTRERSFFEGLAQSSPFQSIGEQVETFAMWCGAPGVPYDDYLSQVRVPVLYVGAAGGVGRYGFHSLTQLGSTDVTRHVVQRLPDAARALDYGHADLWLADDAHTAVWTPILDWMQRH